jgi:hypothetical protein
MTRHAEAIRLLRTAYLASLEVNSPLTAARFRRAIATMVLAFLAADAASVTRDLLLHSLNPSDDGPGLAVRYGGWIVLGVAATFAARAYLQILSFATELTRAQLGIGALIVHAAAALSLPLTSSDLFSNLAYGHLQNAGFNPYLHGPSALGGGDAFAQLVAPRWIHTPSVYGPLMNLIARTATSTGSLLASMAIFKLELWFASLGSIWIASRFAIREHIESFALFAFAPLFIWELSGQAHNDGLMMLALTAFVAALLADRVWLAALFLALALSIKFAAAPLVIIFLAHRLRKSPPRALAIGSLMALVCALLFLPFWDGPQTFRAFLTTLGSDPDRHDRSFTDLAWLLAGPLGRDAQVRIFRALSLLCNLILLAAISIAAFRAKTSRDVLRGGLFVFVLYGLVGTPAAEPWYLTWALPLILCEPNARIRRFTALYAILMLVQYGLPIDPVTYLPLNGVTLWTLWRLWKSPDSNDSLIPLEKLSGFISKETRQLQ